MKLGKRLKALDDMIVKPYSQIWDCCCDHGLLGASLLKRGAAQEVHFIDISEPLTRSLQKKLVRYSDEDGESPNWFVHCGDVSDIRLQRFLDDNQPAQNVLFIIAGVGTDLTIKFVHALIENNPNIVLEFLLCPIRNQFKLREALIKFNLSLLDESIIEENNRFYEAIYVSTQPGQPIAAIGSTMWELDLAHHQIYLEKTIVHYSSGSLENSNRHRLPLELYLKLSMSNKG